MKQLSGCDHYFSQVALTADWRTAGNEDCRNYLLSESSVHANSARIIVRHLTDSQLFAFSHHNDINVDVDTNGFLFCRTNVGAIFQEKGVSY